MLVFRQGLSSNTVSLTHGETLGSLVGKASYIHAPLVPALPDSPSLKGKHVSSERHDAENSFLKFFKCLSSHNACESTTKEPLMNALYNE